MLQKILQLSAWGSIVAIGALTLVPIEWRPQSGLSGHLEHVAAYLAAATLFSFSYPRRSLIVMIALFLIYAACLEIGQQYIPGRHALFSDWIAKSFGALIGVFVGTFFLRLWLQFPHAIEKKARAESP